MQATLINHQTQPCPISCVTTCIAMVADIPVADIYDNVHTRYQKENLSIREILDELKIPFKSFDSADRNSVCDDGAYITSVPSLNIVGGMHQIIIEVTDDLWWVFDPNEGKGDRLYYVAEANPDNKLEVSLSSGYNVEAFISREWLEKRKT